jgi:hypothetical protein
MWHKPERKDLNWKERLSLAVAGVFILPVVIFAPVAQAQSAARPQTQKRMALAVDRTLQEGLQAQLPPHLSTLLGISAEKECLVMQRLVRTGETVQGFDVSMANRNDVVVFVVNESTKDQTLYLTSREGSLRKLVSVIEGVGGVRRITSEERKGFEKEKRFWLDRLAPVEPSK